MKERFVAAVFIMVGVAGCSKGPPPLPSTYPVHGRVTYANGTPVAGGLVQFRSEDDRSVVTSGVIQKDGTFSLVTTRSGLRAEGAVAGPHSVMVTVTYEAVGDAKNPMATRPPTMAHLPTTYNVETRDNDFTLVVGQP